MSEVEFQCETCGEVWTLTGTYEVVTDSRGMEFHFDPDHGGVVMCPNEPPVKPKTNGTAYILHDVSIIGGV